MFPRTFDAPSPSSVFSITLKVFLEAWRGLAHSKEADQGGVGLALYRTWFGGNTDFRTIRKQRNLVWELAFEPWLPRRNLFQNHGATETHEA